MKGEENAPADAEVANAQAKDKLLAELLGARNGPFTISEEGYRYCLTMIDRETGWPEALPIKDICAKTVAKLVYEGWITRHGCFINLTSDQGKQFESSIFRHLMNYLGVHKFRTTAYHPQSNGAIERWHRSLKAALMARLKDNRSWVDEMHTVMMGLRAAPRSDTGVSAAELTFGRTLRFPGEFFEPSDSKITDGEEYLTQLKQVISNLRPKPETQRDSRTIFVHPDLKDLNLVLFEPDRLSKNTALSVGKAKPHNSDDRSFPVGLAYVTEACSHAAVAPTSRPSDAMYKYSIPREQRAFRYY
nr:uncharacterized protein LOC117995756 [Maniola hyperantus]